MRARTVSDDGAVERLLAEGELEILGLMPRASNYTFLARVTAGDKEALAVYKPRRGEAPLWDFPDGTLCTREVAAYVVAGGILVGYFVSLWRRARDATKSVTSKK